MERPPGELSTEFLEFLNDPGIEIRHPRKDRLSAEDLFVFPDLKLSGGVPHRGGRLNEQIISSRDLIEIEKFDPVIIISGPGDSGKTTLLKSLLRHYPARGYYPLYIDGNGIDRLGEDDLRELSAKKYEEQYTEESLRHISGAGKEKRICIFDNFDSVAGGVEDLSSLFRSALDLFGALIFTVRTPFLADLSLSESVPASAPLCFELMEFGLELRSELADKWHALGIDREEAALGQEGIKARKESAMNIMDTVIGRNLVPSYPVFILTILYIGEAQEKEALTGSSYGHYYEYLITKPLKERIGKDASGAYMLFLSRLANRMFIENTSSVTAHELSALRDEQPSDNELPGSAEDTTNTLLDTRSLSVEESGFVFTYRYIYYYFAARYTWLTTFKWRA